ncbi:MAG: amidohydrolase [Acidobacteria bacterium]|nr:amidohydrolase [Acidobacteriota bacterium]
MTAVSAGATTAITNATVVTVDPIDSVLEGATVVVSDDVIAEVLPAGVAPARAIDHRIDARGGILLPGLINAHTHLAMTLFRGYADDLDLQAFLDRLLPAEGAVMSEDHVRIGVRLAIAESFRSGCTTALDMYWWPLASLEEAARAGFDLHAGPIFIGFDGPDHTPWATRLERARATAPHRWLFAHGTYTMDPAQLGEVGALASELGARFHIHAAETSHEVADVRTRFGRSPIELLDDHGLLRPGTVLAHAVVLSDAEIDRIAATGTAVAHCPASNMKLASGFCRVPELQAAGAVVGLGTDGPSSSNDLDMFAAMRVAALIHKGHRLDPLALPACTVLRMATIDGARALGIEDRTGSIEVGKRADLVLLDADAPALTPMFDPVSAVVYAASRADVADVWAGGRRVVERRRTTTIDLERTLVEARTEAERISD